MLRLLVGTAAGEIYTLADVGQRLGVTRERVRQLEKQALDKLRRPGVAERVAELR